MDHVVYLDEGEGDLEALRSGKKTMLALGMSERAACGTIGEGDTLMLSHGTENGEVLAKATVFKVTISPPLSQESCMELMAAHAMSLALTGKQARELVNKKYLVLIELRDLELAAPDGGDRPAEAPAQTNAS